MCSVVKDLGILSETWSVHLVWECYEKHWVKVVRKKC